MQIFIGILVQNFNEIFALLIGQTLKSDLHSLRSTLDYMTVDS